MNLPYLPTYLPTYLAIFIKMVGEGGGSRLEMNYGFYVTSPYLSSSYLSRSDMPYLRSIFALCLALRQFPQDIKSC